MLVFNMNFRIKDLSLKEVIKFAETKAITTDIMKEYLVICMVEDENVLSQICETGITPGDSLRLAAHKDIVKMWESLKDNPLKDYLPSIKRKNSFNEYQQSIESIVLTNSPDEMLNSLILHYTNFGGGKNAQYIAYKYEDGLKGVNTPDDITLERLFCLDRQKKILMDNTLSFLQGLSANNVLLYGDSGSGKSSMIKALLNKYYKEGLRLIEVSKSDLTNLPNLMNTVKDKKFKYIIFLDDLSFESNESGYKDLKVLLDGRIEKQPQNVLLYATSNRRHLVNERWEDRDGSEVHVRDTKNEKMSLSERFGIRIYFASPNQKEYLEIVEGMLVKENLPITDEIKEEAIKWELSYNGRSGRSAVQFVKMLLARNRRENQL